MARPRNPLSFEPSRVGLGSSEEVRVGAYARRQLRRRIAIGVFGVLLIVGAFALYGQLRPPRGKDPADRYPVCVGCASCGHTATVRVRFGQTFPMECPACKELACQVVWECRDCGGRFVPQQTGTVVRCPECDSQRVGSAARP